eukprot:7956200-Alexandrium_andersonii.AAC.1
MCIRDRLGEGWREAPALSEHPEGPKLPFPEVCGTAHIPFCGVCCSAHSVKGSVHSSTLQNSG